MEIAVLAINLGFMVAFWLRCFLYPHPPLYHRILALNYILFESLCKALIMWSVSVFESWLYVLVLWILNFLGLRVAAVFLVMGRWIGSRS